MISRAIDTNIWSDNTCLSKLFSGCKNFCLVFKISETNKVVFLHDSITKKWRLPHIPISHDQNPYDKQHIENYLRTLNCGKMWTTNEGKPFRVIFNEYNYLNQLTATIIDIENESMGFYSCFPNVSFKTNGINIFAIIDISLKKIQSYVSSRYVACVHVDESFLDNISDPNNIIIIYGDTPD